MSNELQFKETPTPPAKPQNKQLAVWQNALLKAESKFLAIADPTETKKEMGFAAQLVSQSDSLKKCDPDSIMNAVINVARTGITLNPVLKLAHLVARKGKCVLDFDYKGLVKILKDNKCCKDLQAVIVYEDETFKESNNQTIPHEHERKYAKTEEEQKNRKYSGVYCQVVLMDNTVIYTQFTPYWEILKAEKASQGAGSEYSPWKNWRESMIKKTKIRSDFKTLISGSPNEKVQEMLKIDEENQEVSFKKKSTLSSIFADEADAEVINDKA